MLEEGEIDENDFEQEESSQLKINSVPSPTNNQKSPLSPALSDLSSGSKSSLTKRKHRHKSQHNKRKKLEHVQDQDERPEIKAEPSSAPMSLFDLFKQSQFNKETG
ncbi:hypothetical protein BpHYR1_029737, partial [Brachionus plicatilis]